MGYSSRSTHHPGSSMFDLTEVHKLEFFMNTVINRPATSFSDTRKLKTIEAAFGIMDIYTQGHAQRVSIYAMRLAKRVGLAPDEIDNIALGGLLHDIGKAGLSQRIFYNKEATLSSDMLAEVRLHPIIGVSILRSIEFLAPVVDYVHYHHERIDGSGYPCGLATDEIPLGAKIISVVDCFDAITTDRSYQKGKNSRKAFAILNGSKGKSFCPGLVDAFIAEIEENGMVAAWPPYGWLSVLPALELRV
jgi:putative nucleotidyltransferase with HDIG domain